MSPSPSASLPPISPELNDNDGPSATNTPGSWLCPVALLVLFSLLAACAVLRVWEGDFNIPFYYLSDATRFPLLNYDVNLYLAIAKNIAQGGWIDTLPRLAAPGEMNLAGYPFAFFQQHIYLCLNALSVLGLSEGAMVNLFFLLTFPSIALAAFWAFRTGGLSVPVAMAVSLLYAFLPFHFFSGQMHMALSAYTCVPLCMVVCFWLLRDGFYTSQQKLHLKRVLLTGGILCLTVTTDVYYVAYGIIAFLTTGMLAACQAANFHQRQRALFGTAGCLAGLSLGLVLVSLPAWFPGDVPPVQGFDRFWRHTEDWGTKMIQFLLPVRDHFIPAMAHLAHRYNASGASNVNESAALGLAGSIGFCVLLWKLVIAPASSPLWQYLSRIQLVCLLFAMIGGLGTIFAFLVTPELRANYRMVVYIGWIALMGFGLLLDALKQNRFFLHRQTGFHFFLAGIVALGILDQTGRAFVPPYTAQKQLHANNEAFFQMLESKLPPNSAVLQLPYVRFPESGWVGKIAMYESFLPYIHSTHLRWSYGPLYRTEADAWYEAMAQPDLLAENIPNLCEKGFQGVLVDTYGYDGQPEVMESMSQALARLSNHPGWTSSNDRYRAYPICTPQETR